MKLWKEGRQTLKQTVKKGWNAQKAINMDTSRGQYFRI